MKDEIKEEDLNLGEQNEEVFKANLQEKIALVDEEIEKAKRDGAELNQIKIYEAVKVVLEKLLNGEPLFGKEQ